MTDTRTKCQSSHEVCGPCEVVEAWRERRKKCDSCHKPGDPNLKLPCFDCVVNTESSNEIQHVQDVVNAHGKAIGVKRGHFGLVNVGFRSGDWLLNCHVPPPRENYADYAVSFFGGTNEDELQSNAWDAVRVLWAYPEVQNHYSKEPA